MKRINDNFSLAEVRAVSILRCVLCGAQRPWGEIQKKFALKNKL
jgi:hypothetical protein